MATEQITVRLGDKDHVIYRDEIMGSDDAALRDVLILRDNTKSDLDDAMLKVHQLKHALSSMENTMQQLAVRYIAAKYAQTENLDQDKGDSEDG